MVQCSPERPWGIHPPVRNDEQCRQCGWTAPGPIGDARVAGARARTRAAALGWAIVDGGAAPAERALAA